MSKDTDYDKVRKIIADTGEALKAELEAGAATIDPVEALENAYGLDMQRWPPEAMTAFVAMQMAVLPHGPPLHETPRHMIVPTLRRAYTMVRRPEG